MNLDELNAATPGQLRPHLLACCDVPRWADALLAGRPYPDVEALLATSDKSAREFTAAEVDRALAAHPRLGERAQGEGTAAAWSHREQSSVSLDDAMQAALVEGNHAYEERFGRVFLISASGLSGDKILIALRERLGHDPASENAIVADELRKIALLRLRKLIR